MQTPRPEYPRPNFYRNDWINLNGSWTFTFDYGLSGMGRGYHKSLGFADGIIVPFCPESALSGVHHNDFIPAMWYQRSFAIPDSWRGKKIMLHVGASDYETDVYVNDHSVGRHWGGSSSFSFDLTGYLIASEDQNIVIAVYDNLRSGAQLGGKQSLDYESAGCFYSRITGIWQTVWLEAVNNEGLQTVHLTPLYDQAALLCAPVFHETKRGSRLTVRIKEGETVVASETVAAGNLSPVLLPIPNLRAWSPESPFLYSLEYLVENGNGEICDQASSYAGIRKVHVEGNKIFLNNEPIYLRLVLDQGYYPSGLWTAPSDAALKHDIELSLAAGFNGARLHQKVFEPRFHYWADTLGYLTWAESPSWGLDVKSDQGARNYLSEWREIVLRDRNHPSIIAWTTLNETWDISDKKKHNRIHTEAYNLTRSLDPTRPVNNASGGCHVITDLYTVHIYEQNPELLQTMLTPTPEGKVFQTLGDKEVAYSGQPYIVDEFGGIKWIPDGVHLVKDSWGYGEPPRTIEEFYDRLEKQVIALLSLPHICGYCYTQLTDVEQEQNGLVYYDRSHKFSIEKLRAIFSLLPHNVRKSPI